MRKVISVSKMILLLLIMMIFSFSSQASSERSTNDLLYGAWKPVSFINEYDEVEEFGDCSQLSRCTFYKNGNYSQKDVWEWDGECHEDLEEGSWKKVGSSRYVLETINIDYGREYLIPIEVRISFTDKNTMQMVTEEGETINFKRVS